MQDGVGRAVTRAASAPGREEVVIGELSALYSSALSLGMPPAEAEERVAEAVAVAWRTASDRDGESGVRVTLYRSLLRLRPGVRRRPGSAAPGAPEASRPTPSAVPAEAAVEVADALDPERVRELVASLPDELAVVLVLADVAGLSYAEVATTLGCARRAVASRLAAARRVLDSRITESFAAAR